MTLAVAQAVVEQVMSALADDGSALGGWRHLYGVPSVLLGYAKPKGAPGWPFVAIEPGLARWDVRRACAVEASVGLACGYLLGQVADAQNAGLIAVETLAEAVLAVLGRPWRVSVGGTWWEAGQAVRVDALYSHPRYEVEYRVDMARVGLYENGSEVLPAC